MGKAPKAKAKPKTKPSSVSPSAINEEIKQQFYFFDTSNNGTIEEEELMSVFLALGGDWTKQKIRALLKQMDSNHDGRVSFEEFVDFVFRERQVEQKMLTDEEMDKVKQSYAEMGIFDEASSDFLLEQAVNAHYYKMAMKEKALTLLDSKADPNKADRNGTTVLMHMTPKIDATFAKQMIDAGADPARTSKTLDCPVFIAASQQSIDLLRLFLIPDTEPLQSDEAPDGELSKAEVRETMSEELITGMPTQTPARVRELLQKKADLNYTSNSGWTPLTRATFLDRKDIVQVLIQSGSGMFGSRLRLGRKNKQGRTALHLAARKGLVEMLDLLLKSKADPDSRDPDGWTPLHHACFCGQDDAVKLLLDQGADLHTRAFGGLTPYMTTRLRDKPGDLGEGALELVRPPPEVDFGKAMLPILKDEEISTYQKIENLLSLPTVRQNIKRLRLGEHFFDPTNGPNKVKLKKVWELLIQPLIESLRTGDVGLPQEPPNEDARQGHLYEIESRKKLQKQFFEIWMEESKGPQPSVHWKHANREAYAEEMHSFMSGELAIFKEELDGVYRKIQEAEGGPELIALPAEEVCDESLLTQLGAHPRLAWVEDNLDATQACEYLRLVGAVEGKDDDQAAALAFAEMLTFESEFLSGEPFWRNIYRFWLANYGKIANSEFHHKFQKFAEKFNTEHEDEGFSADYAKGPLKTYERMKEDERDRGMVASAESFEGRTTAASCLDIVRGTISVDSPSAALAVLDSFRKLDLATDHMKLVQVKNYFNESVEGMDGYRYLELNVLYRAGLRAGACGRPDKSIPVAVVGEVQIVLTDYTSIKKRRSLQYKLWRGFFDWPDEKEQTTSSSLLNLSLRGNKGLYDDDE